VDVHPIAAAGFGAAAEIYERARPSYPAEAVDWIVERVGLREGVTVLDLAAGTGKLTRLLVPTGARVIAVEPVPEMRAVLVRAVPGAEVLEGTAERIPLEDESVDVLTVAQAMHWFDLDRALPELHRVLRPGGCVVAVWNSRDTADPLQRGLEELLTEHRGVVTAQREGAWRTVVEASPLFGPVEKAHFRHEQLFTADDLCDRVASTSFVATMSEPDRAALLGQVRALAAGREEPFSFPYETEVHVIPRTR
jgi:SAM-dependent methyltransferase